MPTLAVLQYIESIVIGVGSKAFEGYFDRGLQIGFLDNNGRPDV